MPELTVIIVLVFSCLLVVNSRIKRDRALRAKQLWINYADALLALWEATSEEEPEGLTIETGLMWQEAIKARCLETFNDAVAAAKTLAEAGEPE
jgi:hypothetical protein